MILGHAHPRVVAAVQAAAQKGTSYGAPTAGEVEIAHKIVSAIPSIEQVRLVNSGTEATMSALRVARAFTGKPQVVKFAGCYHGHVDALLVRAGSGATTLGVPDSAGVPGAFAALTRIAEFNNLESVRAWFRAEGDGIGAVIVEPIPGNMGVVPPLEGFLEELRTLTAEAGAILIFDEVISGFRASRGGAQERLGVVPDITCLGKIIGGGLPVGAFGGRADLMSQLAPAGEVYQAGTLSGNPLAVAAGLATLDALTPQAYEYLEALGARLEDGLQGALYDTGTRACVQRVGSMATVFFGVDSVTCYEEALQADTDAYARFFHEMLARGVYLAPSQFEAMFLSLAHTEEDVEVFIRAAGEALRAW
jgi:glutamate-1-semialdehyde 2,1-aminomutase